MNTQTQFDLDTEIAAVVASDEAAARERAAEERRIEQENRKACEDVARHEFGDAMYSGLGMRVERPSNYYTVNFDLPPGRAWTLTHQTYGDWNCWIPFPPNHPRAGQNHAVTLARSASGGVRADLLRAIRRYRDELARLEAETQTGSTEQAKLVDDEVEF